MSGLPHDKQENDDARLAAEGHAGSATPSPRPRSRLLSVVLLALALGWAIVRCVSLVTEAATGQTDFSVLFRTAVALRAGADGGLYSQVDLPTGGLHCIPPFGSLLLLPLTPLPVATAGAVWGLINLLILVGSALALRAVLGGVDRYPRLHRSTWVAAVLVMVGLSSDALLTGQFTVVMVAGWVVYLWASACGSDGLAALGLALPAAMKFYPALMWVVPAFSGRRRQALLTPVLFVALCVVPPLAVYGPRAWELSRGYVRGMTRSDNSRMTENMRADYVVQQGFEPVLLRYLTTHPAWHAQHPWFPHLDLPRPFVLHLGAALRCVILLLSAWLAWRLRRGCASRPRHGALMLTGLWAAAMYLMLPDAASRYALYLLPTFLMLLVWTAGALRRGAWRGLGMVLLTLVCFLCAVQLGPRIMRPLGTGLVGSLTLWGLMVGYCWREARRVGR